MRVLTLVVCTALAAGCATQDDDASLPADTAHFAAPAPAGVSAASFNGTWKVDALAIDRDTVLTSYTFWGTDGDPAGWQLKYDNHPDTLAVRVTGIQGDSLIAEVGPYSSVLRPNVSVSTRSAMVLRNDTLVGHAIARYAVTTADSVLSTRIKGVRIN